MAEVAAPARDHGHAERRKNQVKGEEFPDAVYHCWTDGDRDRLVNCRKLQEDHRDESGCGCIQRELDRGRWTCGRGVNQKGEDPEVAVAVAVLGGEGEEVE